MALWAIEPQTRPEGSRGRIAQPAAVAAIAKLLQQRSATTRLLATWGWHRLDLAVVHVDERVEYLAPVQFPQCQKLKPHAAAPGFLDEVRGT